MRMGVDIRGFRELDRALGEMPRATARGTLRRVGRDALEPVAQMAAALAPERTGRLAFSIDISDKGTRRAEWARGLQRHEFIMAVGPAAGTGSLSYATFAEFGTIDTAAHPFMRPAWLSGQATALDHVRTELAVEIRKVADRAARKAARAGQ